MSNVELEQLAVLSDLSKEQIVDYLPGRYFMYKNKRYECVSCRLLPDNKKFSIITYTNPVVIAYSDIDELTMVHGVIMEKYVPKKKSGPKVRKEYVTYDYVLLVKIVNKHSDISWAEFAENVGMPDQASTLYQKYNSIKAKAADEGITMNQYIDAIKEDIGHRLKRKLNIKPAVKKPLSDEITQATKTGNQERSNNGKQHLSDNSRYKDSFKNGQRRTTESQSSFKESIKSEENSNCSNEEFITSSEETEQNRNSSEYTNEEQSTENGNEDTSKPQFEQKKILSISNATEGLQDVIDLNSLGTILQLTGIDKLLAAGKIFELSASWNKRRCVLQMMFPNYQPFVNKDFKSKIDKPEYSYLTVQETDFHNYLISELKKLGTNPDLKSIEFKNHDQSNDFDDLEKLCQSNDNKKIHQKLFVDNKTHYDQDKGIFKHQQIYNIQPDGREPSLPMSKLLNLLIAKRDEYKAQMDYHNYLINLYNEEHK